MGRQYRAGRFVLQADAVFDHWETLGRFFSEVIVFQADHNTWTGKIVYDALSRHFDPIEWGDFIPMYEISISSDGFTVRRES